MPRTTTHIYNNANADSGNTGQTLPSDWNRNHTTGDLLTNKSGVTLNVGDVVGPDTATDEGVILRDTSNYIGPLYVTLGQVNSGSDRTQPVSITNNSTGLFCSYGEALTLCQGSVTRGNYLRKSATTKALEDMGIAANTNTPPLGAVAVALQSGTTTTLQCLWLGTVATSGVLFRFVGNPFKDVNTTAAETSIFSSAPTIKGNTLGTNRVLRVTIFGDILANRAAGDSFSLKFKYGATTYNTLSTGPITQSATRYGWRSWGEIGAAGATGAQAASGEFSIAPNTGVSGSGGGAQSPGISTHTGITEDSTADKTYDITVTPSASSANLSLRVFVLLIELL